MNQVINTKGIYSLNNNKEKPIIRKKPDIIFLLIFGIYISFNINGFLGSVPGLRGEFNLAISLLVIAYVALFTPGFFNKFIISNKAYLLIITLVLICLFDFLLGRDFSFFLSFLPVIVYYAAFTYMGDKQLSKGLLAWIMLNIIYKIILTVYWLRIDELIVKRYDHIGYAGADGITRSIIGYGAIYLITPCIILWLEYIFSHNVKRKLLVFVTALCSIYMVYVSQISMMIFALTIMLLFYLLMRKIKKNSGRLTLIVIVVAVSIIYVFRIPILTYLSDLDFLGSTVNNRINGLLTVLSNGMEYVYSEYSGSMVAGDSVVNRFYAYGESFKAFSHNFFLGYLTPDAYPGAGHSGIIDLISVYGIFTIGPLLVLLINGYKNNIAKYSEHVSVINIIYLYILAISVLNNLSTSTIFLITYILMPQVLMPNYTEREGLA